MGGMNMFPSNLMRNSVVSVALDRIDLAIIAALQKNARLSNKELAAKVNLAPSSCLARVRKLTETKVLEGFHAEVNPGALGGSLQAIIAVRLRRHSRLEFRSLYTHIRRFPEILQGFHVYGGDDLLLHVGGRPQEPSCLAPFGILSHCVRRVNSGAGKAHETHEPRGHPLSWSRPHAAELRADEEAGRGVESNADSKRSRETDHLPGICGGPVRCSQALGPAGSRSGLQSANRGIRSQDDVEALQCVHECGQGTRFDPPVP